MPTYDQWKVSFFFFWFLKSSTVFRSDLNQMDLNEKSKLRLQKLEGLILIATLVSPNCKLKTSQLTKHFIVHIYYFFKIKLCHSFWFTVKFAAWTFNSKLVGATIIYHVRDGSRTELVQWPRVNNFWIIMKK